MKFMIVKNINIGLCINISTTISQLAEITQKKYDIPLDV